MVFICESASQRVVERAYPEGDPCRNKKKFNRGAKKTELHPPKKKGTKKWQKTMNW